MNGNPWNVVGQDGLHGRLIGSGPHGSMHTVEVEFDDGRHVNIPREMLESRPDGMFTVDLSRRDLNTYSQGVAAAPNKLSVVQEEIAIDKRKVQTGEVAVHITPHTRQEVVDIELSTENVEVQRVPVNQIVDAPTAPHEEGDVTIVPVYEEVVVLQKKLVLKEEIHIRRRATTRQERQAVTLRSENVEVLRADVPNPPNGKH